MPFNQKPQKFNAKINTVTVGTGDKAVTIGGNSTFPFYTFDAPTENRPKIGVEITDMGLDEFAPGIKAYYEGCTTMAEIAKKAAAMEGGDFVVLNLDGGDPNGVNKSTEELIAVVTTQLGVDAKKIVMNVGTATVGYGYEYVVSTMDRIKGAALSQNDNMLQMPIITPVSSETWGVKESVATEEDMPEWGSEDERGINMEVMTAAADLAAGSDAVILRHPESIKTIAKMIDALV